MSGSTGRISGANRSGNSDTDTGLEKKPAARFDVVVNGSTPFSKPPSPKRDPEVLNGQTDDVVEVVADLLEVVADLLAAEETPVGAGADADDMYT